METCEQMTFINQDGSLKVPTAGRTFTRCVKIIPDQPETEKKEDSSVKKTLPNNTSDRSEESFVGQSLSKKTSEGTGESFVRRALPNKAFDQEYMTEWTREVKFLADNGIHYVYVKKTPDYGISQFKYKKTPALFEALAEYYRQIEKERSNLASADEVQEALKTAGISIKRGRNGSIKFIKEESESETK